VSTITPAGVTTNCQCSEGVAVDWRGALGDVH